MAPFQVVIEGKAYELAPLSFAGQKRCKGLMRQMNEEGFADADELFEAMTTMLLESLTRNHPQVTREQLQEVLDWPIAKRGFEHLMVISFPMAEQGESKAASPSGASTGTS